jgi:hypothetical protein
VRDDDDLPLNVEDLNSVEPGVYEAVILSTKKVRRFGLWTVEFRFRLVSPGPAFDVHLLGYCSLGPTDKGRIGPHSKLASWARLIAAFSRVSPSRVTLRSFKQYWLRVQVNTVTRNSRQQSLALHNQYSTVTDILAVVGKLDVPVSVNARPAAHQTAAQGGDVS